MEKNYFKSGLILLGILLAVSIQAQSKFSSINDLIVSQDTFDFGIKERGIFLTKLSYSITNNGLDTAFITSANNVDPFIIENGYSFVAPGITVQDFITIDRSFAEGEYSKTLTVTSSLNNVSFIVMASIVDNTPALNSNEVYYWVGSGNSMAILDIDFNDGIENESVAFGYKFTGTVLAQQMLTEIAEAYPNLIVDVSGGFLNSIQYENHNASSGNPYYWSTLSRTQTSLWEMNWGLTTIINNEDWFGCSYTDVDSDYDPLNLPGNPVWAGYPTAIEEMSPSEIEFYPNPVSDNLLISTNSSLIKSIVIYDISGKLLLSENYSTGIKNQSIDVSVLPDGIYQININYGDMSEIKRFIKK